jgi:hypothetical protein
VGWVLLWGVNGSVIVRCSFYAMHESVGVRASEQGRPGNLIDLLDSPTKNLVEKMFIFTTMLRFPELELNCAAVTALLIQRWGVDCGVLNTLQHPNFLSLSLFIFIPVTTFP